MFVALGIVMLPKCMRCWNFYLAYCSFQIILFILAVKKSIIITIENENGVVREYCGIDVMVTALVPRDIGSSIEEYL